MALEAPIRSSVQFPFGSSPVMSATSGTESNRSPARVVSSPPPATDSSSLLPSSANRIPSNFHIMSPSDIVGPSPVTSNGTETTEIEDDATEEVQRDSYVDSAPERHRSETLSLATDIPENVRQGGEEAVSVIHAPENFSNWKSQSAGDKGQQGDAIDPTNEREASLAALNGESPKADKSLVRPISTDVKPIRFSIDSATPRAQDLDDMLSDGSRLRSSSTGSLEKIEEQTENEGDDEDYDSHAYTGQEDEDEIASLRVAFQESWKLCTTFATLSYGRRSRMYSNSNTPDAHERAWRTCWKLCRVLQSSSADSAQVLNVRTSLDHCREFCQALFDIRDRTDPATDAVLRVNFELAKHLYSSQDRSLPDEFQERTLDFYITMCHRLMKQREEYSDETDQRLRACWGLAEMLFNLRQSKLERRQPDETLLQSAVQACWDLMDIYRHGWAQVQPDRNTPRPSQASFGSLPSERAESRTSNRSSRRGGNRESVKSSSKSSSRREEKQQQQQRNSPPASRNPRAHTIPETPVTEFEDTPVSPESRSPQMPNIMVLGTSSGPSDNNGRGPGGGARWSSNASNLSSYSQSTKSSTRTSSTATTTATAADDVNLGRAKVLVLRTAMNLGFNRDSGSAHSSAKSSSTATTGDFQKFVQSLPSDSFGPAPAQRQLLEQYKNSVLTDNIIPRGLSLPARGKRVTAHDMAKSVHVMSRSSTRYAYLQTLFGLVFQFPMDQADSRRSVYISV